MADVLTSPNGCVSSCFTLNAQEAQGKGKEFINRLSSLYFAKSLTSVASSSSVDVAEVDKSLPKSETGISVPADYVSKHNVIEFLSQSFWHMMQKLGEQIRLFYPIFHTDPVSV